MIRKIVDFDKLRGYPQSSYAFLWVILCVVVVLVHLTAAVIITKSTDLRVSAASGSAVLPCIFSPASVEIGKSITVTSNRGNVFGEITIQGVYLPTPIPLGMLAKQSSAIVKVPFVESGLYVVRVGSPAVNCKTTSGSDLAIQNTIIPVLTITPKPLPTPSPTPPTISAACNITPSTIKPGGVINVAGRGFTGLTYSANLLGFSTTQYYNLGPFNGNTGTYIIPPIVTPGIYTVRIFSGSSGDNGVRCIPDLVII